MVCTAMMAVVVYTITRLWFHNSSWSRTLFDGGCGLHDHKVVISQYQLQPVFRTTSNLTLLEGPVFKPSSAASVFTLVPQHDINMEDNTDWEVEWNELANKAWVPETQLAGSTQISVQDFCRWWTGILPLPLHRSRSPYVH